MIKGTVSLIISNLNCPVLNLKNFAMKNKLLKQLLCLLSLLSFLPSESFATHIVGGEMTYECLGNDQYQISLKIYRDCETGVPWFDNPASIGIFDAQNNTLISSLTMFLDSLSNDTISSIYPDTCLPSYCLHTTTYTKVITLPFRPSGYILSYQRCCRNNIIVNIVDPNSSGMTLTTEITSAALLACNNSPQFIREAPIHLTANDSFSIDLSATDIDGDSLVYVFYAPFDGASSGNPVPNPPLAPPYSSVSYHSPYNYQAPLGNPLLFEWDASTGVLSGTPSILGSFLVGFSILEYNAAGDLLSRVYKDFTIMVTPLPCDPISSTTQITTAPSIELFPNPTDGQLNINTSTDGATQLKVYSIHGQILLEQSFYKNTSINLKNWTKGVYFLAFRTENKQIIKKVIKQ